MTYGVWKIHLAHCPYFTLSSSHGVTFPLFNTRMHTLKVRVCKSTIQCLVMLGHAGGHTKLQSFCSSCRLSQGVDGTEGAASSKFGPAKVIN